ncbi:unnamed protein product [Camellia sinensis]
MVVKMMKWSPWPPAPAAKKIQVRVNEMKLEGFSHDDGGDEREKAMVIEMRWKGGPKTGLVSFHRRSSSKRRKHISNEAVVKKGESVKWNDEFENICSFPIIFKDNSFGVYDASFTILYGGGKTEESKAKLAVIGKVSLNLAELASKMDSMIETKHPIQINVAGVAREATLSVCLSFVEVRNSQDSLATVSTSQAEISSDDSDESAVFESNSTSENELISVTRRVEVSSTTESELGMRSNSQLDTVKKAGLFSWKRKRLSFTPGKTKGEPLIKKTGRDDGGDENTIGGDRQHSVSSSFDSNSRPKLDVNEPACEQTETSTIGHWEEKELVSRDGQAKLKANVFFASFDQCSDKAIGESACTALVAVIANWLQSNQDNTPTRAQFDRLILEGSSEWRKLCDNQNLINQFPNKHFDIETVLQAGLCPISVLHNKSFIGFFGPEKFEALKEFMSFDQIWDEIKKNAEGDNGMPRIYIVSWNDHFFVLKVDINAYYIIDTLGERLFEGCNQAYILRFDDSALMRGKVEKQGVSSNQASEEEICSGKECCREFMKRFLAAIPLRELESEEKKEPVSYFALHQRLQIEFNFTASLSLSSSSSASSTNSTSSLFSNESTDR